PHLQLAASQRSEFLPSVPIGEGITGPARRDSSQSESSGSNDVQAPKSETSAASADPNPQTAATAKPKQPTYTASDLSFVRDKPSCDANSTGTLEPGTRIKVQSKTGDYFRVRSLDRDREPISGYVHREDAFFEPTK